MYSQYDEEIVLEKCFAEKKGAQDATERKGRLLDLGAHDGQKFSNSRRLIEIGWNGVLVEASPTCFARLTEHYKDTARVELVCSAVDDKSGIRKFWDNGRGVGTLEKEKVEARAAKNKGKLDLCPIWVNSITVEELLTRFPPPYDFVSIDIEGRTLPVARALMKEFAVADRPAVICIEYWTDEERAEIEAFAEGYQVLHATPINLLLHIADPAQLEPGPPAGGELDSVATENPSVPD